MLIVADATRVESVQSWLRANGTNEAEVRTQTLADQRVLFIISAGIDACFQDNMFFRGTAVSPEKKTIAFGLEGWLRLRPRLSDLFGVGGEFIATEWDQNHIRVARDVFTNVPLLHTSDRGIAAASDSLLLLADLRTHLGLSNTQNDAVLLARSILSSHAGQQLGPATQIREIRFVPGGQGLVLRLAKGSDFKLAGQLMADRVIDTRVDHVEELRTATAFVAGSVAGLADVPDHHVALQLSGGYDSRLMLGGALRMGAADGMTFETRNTLPSHAEDFKVVTQLAAHFGFKLNAKVPAQQADTALDVSPIAIWAATLMGVYDRLVPPRAVIRRSNQIGLTGMGAEILKGNWNWQSLADLTRDFRDDEARVETLRLEAAAGIRALGADPKWQDASELLYVGYRNGLHGSGGHIGMRMTNVTLLQQIRLAAVGHARIDRARNPRFRRHRATFLGSYSAIADMLALMHPELAAMPYDVARKAMTPTDVQKRLATLGGPLADSELQGVQVIGTPAAVPGGPSSLGIGVARRRGFDIDARADAILERGAEGVAALDSEQVRIAYGQVIRSARHNLIKKKLSPGNAGFSPSKILTTSLFAD